MASSRKKQDENNLKTLRELGALPQNKFCFDCGQRGPTYLNVTIGSFVCTKCSGILRGLTPPHRVKSISMATFTADEIDVVRNRGNDYCKRVWLALHEGAPPTHSGDEQQVRDFMVEKYERKRYYMEKGANKTEAAPIRPPAAPTQNGTGPRNGLSRNTSSNNNPISRATTNGTSRSRPEARAPPSNNNNLVTGFADFDKADIFSASNTGSSQGSQQNGFADFEHNTVFNASSTNSNDDAFSIFDLQFTSHGPTLNQVPLFPRCHTNRWSMPTPAALNAWASPLSPQNGALNGLNTTPIMNSTPPPPPVQDKYAALKDLDNEMKQQHQHDAWSSSTTGSTGSLYSSSTPTTGSVYGSPSPQGSIFGSPSQGQFMTSFAPFQENNPFGANPWGQKQSFVNPFREQNKGTILQPILPSNGATNGLSNGWGSNPFKVGTVSSTNANNPFL